MAAGSSHSGQCAAPRARRSTWPPGAHAARRRCSPGPQRLGPCWRPPCRRLRRRRRWRTAP
eukprot:361894-Chlamydomonas_euryale.AAC.11